MKVLIISHNPLSTFQNMGKTLSSLFSSFEKEELCQLYIYPSLPDVDKCTSYFRITDIDIFRSYFSFGKVHQMIVNSNEIDVTKHDLYETSSDKDFLNKKRNSLHLLLRDIMWKNSNWYSNDLKSWLNVQRPTCIFLAPGDSKFIYNIGLKISKDFNLPLIMYICDDYYFVNKKDSCLDQFSDYLLKKTIEKTINHSCAIVTICDELKESYSSFFNKSAIRLYTGSSIKYDDKANINYDVNIFSYLGNLSIWRYESLCDLGEAIDNYNVKHNTHLELNVYSNYLPKKAEDSFSSIKCINYCGFLTGNEYIDTLFHSDVLIHVESFRDEAIDRVKHSISTKIADSLSSGIPLLAYGPGDIASIRYLEKEEAAFVVTKRENINDIISSILNYDNRLEMSNKELLVSKKNHSEMNNSKQLYSLLNTYENSGDDS